MCDRCTDTVFIELVEGVTAQVTYTHEDYDYAVKHHNLLDVNIVRLMMTPDKLNELIDRI